MCDPNSDLPALVVADRPPNEAETIQVRELSGQRPVVLLDLSADGAVDPSAFASQQLPIDKLLDVDRYHAEVLAFLNAWEQQTLVDGRPFADVFRQTTGHSLWWTGPGSLRHPFSGPILPTLRSLWVSRVAIERERPSLVIGLLQDPLANSLLAELCRNRTVDFAPRSKHRDWRPSATPWWIAGSVVSLIGLGGWIAIRALYARWATRPRTIQGDSPTIVMSGWYPNHVRNNADRRPEVAYWHTLTEALKHKQSKVEVRYLLHTTTYRFHGWKRFLRPFCTGWRHLRRIDDVLPLTQCFPQLRVYIQGAIHQLRMMRVYNRFERTGGLSTAPRFMGIDVSSLIVPHLRGAIGSMAKWSRNVAATAASLQQAGSVQGVLVHEEFYPKGMLTIAAAQSLGIPSLGVQHGQIGPQHTVYMPPSGHVTNGPCPDWFAAYGRAVRDVLSHAGAYPPGQIRVVGAPRFDRLICQPPDSPSCRRLLGWSSDERVVLVTTETYELSAPIVQALGRLACQHSDWRFVIKLHPHDRSPQRYDELLQSTGASNMELVTDRLPERLVACNVLVTGYSTTAMEGLLVGKPVVCADFTTWPDRYPYVPGQVAAGARCPEELWTAITRAIEQPTDSPSRAEFLRSHLGPTVDGRAAATFVATIEELFLNGSGETGRS